jgi:hypothetical protein
MKNSVAIAIFSAVVAATPAQAAVIPFTSKAAFDAAIAGFTSSQTVDFESVAAGTTFPSGTGTGGLTFTYSIDGLLLQVSDTFGTTSGSNYLGLNNPDTAFSLGDSFTINFNQTVNAVGLYAIAGSDAQAGDIKLSAGGGSVTNSAIADTTVSDGEAFFLGLVETDLTLGFTSAIVEGILPASGNAFLAFTVDDISIAGDLAVSQVPEPGIWSLMLAGFGLLAWRRRPRTTQRVSQ